MKLVYPYTIFNSRRAEQVKTTIAGPCLYSASEFIANVYILVKITKLSTPIKQVVFNFNAYEIQLSNSFYNYFPIATIQCCLMLPIF